MSTGLTRVYGYDKAKLHPAWQSFKKHMRDREYDRERLNTAWDAFKKGWEEADLAASLSIHPPMLLDQDQGP